MPRLITTGREVSPGSSGGITPLGTAGAAAGALLIAGVTAVLVTGTLRHPIMLTVFAAGFSGAILDSLLGATVEGRCNWIDNQMVNLLATAWGAMVALALTG